MSAVTESKGAATAEVLSGHSPPPSASKQKSFIVENHAVLNRQTRLAILHLVKNENCADAILVNEGTGALDINLDACEASNPEVLLQIYNKVKGWVDSLSQPMGGLVSQHS